MYLEKLDGCIYTVAVERDGESTPQHYPSLFMPLPSNYRDAVAVSELLYTIGIVGDAFFELVDVLATYVPRKFRQKDVLLPYIKEYYCYRFNEEKYFYIYLTQHSTKKTAVKLINEVWTNSRGEGYSKVFPYMLEDFVQLNKLNQEEERVVRSLPPNIQKACMEPFRIRKSGFRRRLNSKTT